MSNKVGGNYDALAHEFGVDVPHECPSDPAVIDCQVSELPEQWGLIELRRDGTLRAVKEAPVRQALPLPADRLAALMRAVQKTAAVQAARDLQTEVL